MVLGRVPNISIVPLSRFLGIMATATGQYDAAVAHGEDGLGETARLGAVPWHAHGQHDLARALLARDAQGDRDRARELFAEARRTAASLGMRRLIERAAA